MNVAIEDPSRWLLGPLADRYRGLLLGLALGDALGMPVQHRRAGTFLPVGNLLAGGPFDLPRGAWTDDTAVPLCLADSLCARGHADPFDMQTRLARWQREGRLSSTGQCIGISAATARALAAAGAARMLEEKELSGNFRLSSDGTFQYPLVGQVPAAGMSMCHTSWATPGTPGRSSAMVGVTALPSGRRRATNGSLPRSSARMNSRS
mgnify:CR=1 FL=1